MTCCRYRDLEQYFRFCFTLLYCIMHAIPGLRQQIFLLPLHTGGPYKAHGPLDSVQPVWPKVTVSSQQSDSMCSSRASTLLIVV